MRDYVESKNGRISFCSDLYLFIEKAGRRKRLLNSKKEPFEPREDQNGRKYSLFSGKGSQCSHPQWAGMFPSLTGVKWVTVPVSLCRECQFHEPSRHGRRYACCRWDREQDTRPSPLAMLGNAVREAHNIIKGEPCQ